MMRRNNMKIRTDRWVDIYAYSSMFVKEKSGVSESACLLLFSHELIHPFEARQQRERFPEEISEGEQN